jgi:hypothetical protein
MVSSWSNPLPLAEYATTEVVICTYEDRWIPIMYSCLAEALRLYQDALLHGAEIFLFPPNLIPRTLRVLNSQS